MALIVVLSIYGLLALWNNAGKPIDVWYWFGRTESTSIAALAVASFLAGGLVCSTFFALASATLRYRRTREHRRQRLLEEHREELSRKAAMLRVKPPPAPIVKQKELPPTNEPIIVDLREPRPKPTAPPSPLSMPVPMPAATQAATPAPVMVVPTTAPAAAPAPVPVRVEPTDRPAGGKAPIEVEATRATPFASTPSIAPGAKVVEPLPIVEEAKGKAGPLSSVPGGEG